MAVNFLCGEPTKLPWATHQLLMRYLWVAHEAPMSYPELLITSRGISTGALLGHPVGKTFVGIPESPHGYLTRTANASLTIALTPTLNMLKPRRWALMRSSREARRAPL